MDKTFYARVSPGFATLSPGEVIVASDHLDDTHGFTEKGYDTADYDQAPCVVEITPSATRYASRDEVEAAAERAGIRVWMDKEQYLREWPRAREQDFEERMFPATDENEPNQLLARADVVKELEAAGFDAYHDYIVVANTQPLVYAFWRDDTFSASAPVDTVADDPDYPHEVRIAGAPSPKA